MKPRNPLNLLGMKPSRMPSMATATPRIFSSISRRHPASALTLSHHANNNSIIRANSVSRMYSTAESATSSQQQQQQEPAEKTDQTPEEGEKNHDHPIWGRSSKITPVPEEYTPETKFFYTFRKLANQGDTRKLFNTLHKYFTKMEHNTKYTKNDLTETQKTEIANLFLKSVLSSTPNENSRKAFTNWVVAQYFGSQKGSKRWNPIVTNVQPDKKTVSLILQFCAREDDLNYFKYMLRKLYQMYPEMMMDATFFNQHLYDFTKAMVSEIKQSENPAFTEEKLARLIVWIFMEYRTATKGAFVHNSSNYAAVLYLLSLFAETPQTVRPILYNMCKDKNVLVTANLFDLTLAALNTTEESKFPIEDIPETPTESDNYFPLRFFHNLDLLAMMRDNNIPLTEVRARKILSAYCKNDELSMTYRVLGQLYEFPEGLAEAMETGEDDITAESLAAERKFAKEKYEVLPLNNDAAHYLVMSIASNGYMERFERVYSVLSSYISQDLYHRCVLRCLIESEDLDAAASYLEDHFRIASNSLDDNSFLFAVQKTPLTSTTVKWLKNAFADEAEHYEYVKEVIESFEEIKKKQPSPNTGHLLRKIHFNGRKFKKIGE